MKRHELRIEQLGAPTELYDAPATAFVAGFIGTQNYLPGYRVDDSLMMRAELDVMFEAGRAARGLARDAHVLGAVRPENVQLAGDEPSSRNRLKARIAATVMLGDTMEFVLALPDGRELLSRMPRRSSGNLAAGTEVWAFWEPEAFILFPYEELEARQGRP